MIGALLLAASSPAQFGTSPLVDPPHEHKWQPLVEDEGGTVWWDKNVTGKANIDGVEYPKIIVRQVPNEDDWSSEWFAFVDAAIAIDCNGNRSLTIETAANGKLDEPYPKDIHPITPSFQALLVNDVKEVHEMMRAVCGTGLTQ